MSGSRFLVVITNSALDDNPAVTAEMTTDDGRITRSKFFSERKQAVEWCDRMSRIGTTELVLMPIEDSADADARVVASSESMSNISTDDEHSGGFTDFLDEAFDS